MVTVEPRKNRLFLLKSESSDVTALLFGGGLINSRPKAGGVNSTEKISMNQQSILTI